MSLTIKKFEENLTIVPTNFSSSPINVSLPNSMDNEDLSPKLVPFGTLIKVDEKDLLEGFEQHISRSLKKRLVPLSLMLVNNYFILEYKGVKFPPKTKRARSFFG